MKNFNGKVLFLDRSDINTDEIIPAKYLTEITKQALKPFLLEDLKFDNFSPDKDLQGINVIITRSNFGCGWALEVNGINLVIAENFARIFKQNMFNCGMMAVELSTKNIDSLFNSFKGKETFLETDFENSIFLFKSNDTKKEISFKISEFDRSLVQADGWVGYADKHY